MVNNDEKTIANVMKTFEHVCKPKKILTYERFMLMTRKQKTNEKINDYLKDLRILPESCEYGNLKDSIIKNEFVIGVWDNSLRENFLKDSNLNLEKAVDTARASEKAEEQFAIEEREKAKGVMKIQRNKFKPTDKMKTANTVDRKIR